MKRCSNPYRRPSGALQVGGSLPLWLKTGGTLPSELAKSKVRRDPPSQCPAGSWAISRGASGRELRAVALLRVQFRGLPDRIHRGGALAAGMTAERSQFSEGNAADRVFSNVVVGVEPGVGGKSSNLRVFCCASTETNARAPFLLGGIRSRLPPVGMTRSLITRMGVTSMPSCANNSRSRRTS